MSPRPADPTVRQALVDAGVRVLTAEGSDALSARRLAAEAGASAMAVYTYFGNMEGLRQQIRLVGFARLAAEFDALADTDDPVADLTAAVLTYVNSGVGNPELYRLMLVDRPPVSDDDAGAPVFERLRAAVARCIESGRFSSAEPLSEALWAAELWMTGHGSITLALTGLLPVDRVRSLLADMVYRLAVGFGDDPAAARRSGERAVRDLACPRESSGPGAP